MKLDPLLLSIIITNYPYISINIVLADTHLWLKQRK